MICPKCHKNKSALIIRIFGVCWNCNITGGIKQKRIEQTRDLNGWLKEHPEKTRKKKTSK